VPLLTFLAIYRDAIMPDIEKFGFPLKSLIVRRHNTRLELLQKEGIQ
jgi:hypothetical protein